MLDYKIQIYLIGVKEKVGGGIEKEEHLLKK
jgi:hypothetical protein